MIEYELIRGKFAELTRLDVKKLTDETEFAHLELDSLGFIDAIVGLQNAYGVALSQEIILEVKTVGELLTAIQQETK